MVYTIQPEDDATKTTDTGERCPRCDGRLSVVRGTDRREGGNLPTQNLVCENPVCPSNRGDARG